MRPCLRAALAGLMAIATPAGAVVGPSTPGSRLQSSLVMVLNHKGATAGFCTGIVLSPTLVMTAAHCVPPGADLRVHLPGDGAAPVLLPVAGVARHPGYRADAIRLRERSVDLALVALPAPLPARFVPATLGQAAGATPGEPFTLSGYGLGQEGEPRSSGQLRSVGLVARNPMSAVLLWADDPRNEGAGACTGDSGAPVTRADATEVAALAVWSAGSQGHGCGELTQALWLAPYRSWIEATAARLAHSR